MAMHLFPHNKTAYESAVAMLSARGKAAVIHPTGTGKSFIGFKLCEDNPDKTICWLSPSRYIYQTQLENLAGASDGYQPENVKFFTYAKLMLLSDAEIADIKPDFIILDEFHRCGAELWGEGVDKLLTAYPNAKILGLSATAIRYLDNQRDMSDELFDGNVASKMTLGDAIVQGILNPPKYIMTVFSYQKELEKYEQRIAKQKNKRFRDAATEYLEALRRALEKADGLDVIFAKHITEKSGKYIVFCSNIDTMNTAACKVNEWFGKIDNAPHIYRAYSNDPETSKAFADFKVDTSEHLKLLFCIDMLNEGIHIDDVAGVILLRPTISPIIFKQQIGRALSASKSTNPVIFDVVNNIENLYSIDSIKEEMQAAITYYRYTGEHKLIINDSFEVIDEIADCRKLFDKLEGVLSASWDTMYEKAEDYYKLNGDLLIPAVYYTEEGYSLGRWLTTQRLAYAGKTDKPLTQEQIEKLEKIGVIWDSHLDFVWNQYFEKAKEYYEAHGDLKIPKGYTIDGLKLDVWLHRMRQAYANKRYAVVTPEKKAKLDSIGMVWNALSEQWEKNYLEAMQYYNKHGNLYMDIKHMTKTGFKLGYWVSHLRQKKEQLTDEQIKRLDDIGMVWDTDQFRFDEGLCHAKQYYAEYGNLDVKQSYVCDDGFALGKWLIFKRRQYEKGTLSAENIAALDELGMLWNPTEDLWRQMYKQAKKYYDEHGDINVPRSYTTADGRKLAPWLIRQKTDNQNGKLSQEHFELLDKLGMVWDNMFNVKWENGIDHLKKYIQSNGNANVKASYVCDDGFALGQWVVRQRKSLKLNTGLSAERREQLLSCGIM